MHGDKYKTIPEELKKVKRWVCWAGNKLPKNPYTGGNAQSNNPSTWGTFYQAVSALDKYGLEGIGFMFAPPYFGVDLDKCIDNVDFVDEFVDTLGSYTEYSKSGNGIHIICKGKLPEGARRKGNVEMYSEGRFFIMTGNPYKEVMEIAECSETIKILHQKYLAEPKSTAIPVQYEKLNLSDTEIIDLIRRSKNASGFQMLYDGSWQGIFNSQSEADLAFCNILAFWTQRDYQQMDRIFRSSGLMRKKWDENRGGVKYGQKTLEKAIAACRNVYTANTKDVTKIAVSAKQSVEKTEYKEYDHTDTGNGQRFADGFKDIIRYSKNRKKWYFWDGKAWCEDSTNEIRRLADECIQRMKKQAFTLQDEDKQEALLKWANRTASNKGKTNMITEAEHLYGIAISPNYFDKQDDMINMQNGIVNLRNGELIEHSPDYYMSKIGYAECSNTYDKPERWLQFLDEITAGDKELQLYLQKAVGYSLTGSIKEQCLFFCYGNGCNGKSTFMDVISTIMGSYALNMQAESIMVKKNGSAVNTDIARLKGARFVTVAEPDEGVRLNESLVKQLTGGDKITARFLFGEEFEFRPSFKMWICTNHKPVIRGTDDGIWRRIVLIPFTMKIPTDKIDKGLSHKLRKEMPAIVRWAVEGCMMWQKEGLAKPECIIKASEEYRAEMDVLAKFINDCIEEDDHWANEGIKANTAYSVYEKWAEDNNEYIHTATRFGKEFLLRFPEKVRKKDGMYYQKCKFSEYALSNYSEGKNPVKSRGSGSNKWDIC